jgi:hypothetical protein
MQTTASPSSRRTTRANGSGAPARVAVASRYSSVAIQVLRVR